MFTLNSFVPTLNNLFTLLFIIYPFFNYQLNKTKLQLLRYCYWLLLVVPPLWLFFNWQLVNIMFSLFVLSVYYFGYNNIKY